MGKLRKEKDFSGWLQRTFYPWLQRQDAPVERADQYPMITAEIQTMFQEHCGFYDTPRPARAP